MGFSCLNLSNYIKKKGVNRYWLIAIRAKEKEWILAIGY
jgi:hypothetical protein